MKTIVAVIFLLVGVHAAMCAKSCDGDSQCDANECCQKLRKHPIIGKRDSEYNPGECAALIQENGDCDYLLIANGFCGCAPGLNCTFFPETQTTNIVKRSRVPGIYMCVKN